MLVFAGFALVWIKTAMQQISKNHFKSKLFAYFFCIFAFFVVPLRAILRVCTLNCNVCVCASGKQENINNNKIKLKLCKTKD